MGPDEDPAGSQPADPRPGPPAARSHASRRFLAAGLLTLAAAVVALPDLLFGLDRYSPFAQLVAFRPLLLGGLLVLVACAAVVAWLRRWTWPFGAGLLVVALVGGALVLPRVIPDDPPTGGGRGLTVLAFNTSLGEAELEPLAALIRDARPDLVALPEVGQSYRARLAPLVEPLGYRLHTSSAPGRPDVVGVTALVAGELGDVTVRIDDATPFAAVELSGGGLGELRFVAFHALAPTRGNLPQWRADLASLARWCAGATPAVVAGDLNATLDHSALRSGMAGCSDAAEQRGEGLTPTWGPTSSIRLVGPQIDHVLVTTGIGAETFEVLDLPGSDHRAVLTRLRLPA